MAFLRAGKMEANQEKNIQNVATKANWMRVSVAGFGKALRIDLEDVLVRALEKYQMMQSVYSRLSAIEIISCIGGLRTISLGDTGAFRASDISCTFWLTLPLLVRIVLKASLKLFCLPCPCPFPPVLHGGFRTSPLSILESPGCQRSADCDEWNKLFAPITVGLSVYIDCPSRDSTWSGNFSIEVRRLVVGSGGNLKVAARLADDSRVE
jgi:hypothetical protein